MTLTITEFSLIDAIRRVWGPIPAAPESELRNLPWASGENAYRAYGGIAPMNVDTDSAAFLGATSLVDLPPRAAAAYLGPHLLHMVKEVAEQRETGYSFEVVVRAETVAALLQPSFWERVIRPLLPRECQEVLVDVVAYLTSMPEVSNLTAEDVSRMRLLAVESGQSSNSSDG